MSETIDKLKGDFRDVPSWVWLGGAAAIAFIFVIKRASGNSGASGSTSLTGTSPGSLSTGSNVSTAQDYGIQSGLQNLGTIEQEILDLLHSNPTSGGTNGGVTPTPTPTPNPIPIPVPSPVVPPIPSPNPIPQPQPHPGIWNLVVFQGTKPASANTPVYSLINTNNGQTNYYATFDKGKSWHNFGSNQSALTTALSALYGGSFGSAGLGQYNGTYTQGGQTISGYPV